MWRALTLTLLLFTGCSCGPAYSIAVADPGDAGAAPLDLESLPRRCFEGAHTLVVGPAPGCATLEARGVEVHECAPRHDGPGWRGTPLRVIRRGSLPVRLSVLPRCTGCPTPPAVGAPQVIRMLAFADGEPVSDCSSCGSETVLRVGDEVVGYARTSTVLGFATLEREDTVEVLLVGPDTVFEATACAVEPTATMVRFLEACEPYCSACGRHPTDCRNGCVDAAVLEPDACLEARATLAACRTGSCEAPCEPQRVRVEYECRAP